MIRYTLKCADGHAFESWFQSAEAFDTLCGRGLVSCATCGSADVRKALMAPRVTTRAAPVEGPAPAMPQAEPPSPTPTPLTNQTPHPAEPMLKALKAHIEKNSTYVGGQFAKVARDMHLGDIPEKPIHGEASPAEAKALVDDGVPIAPLPIMPKSKMN